MKRERNNRNEAGTRAEYIDLKLHTGHSCVIYNQFDNFSKHMQKITPNLWFKGRAEEAVNFYLSVFPNSKILTTSYYPTEGLLDFQKPFAGKVLAIYFELLGQEFVAINAGDEFTFNEAVSFNVTCKTQAEIDYYWDKLTSDGGVESQCGWLKDKYGLSWQVNPENIEELMQKPHAFARLLEMKKIDIQTLQDV